MSTLVANSTEVLSAVLDEDTPPAQVDATLTVALADATAGHGLTVTWEGSDEGERSTYLGKAGDTLVLPLHGISHYRVESDAYPTTITRAILRSGASIRTGITRTA